MKADVEKIGFWSACLSALFSILWFVTYNLRDVLAAVPTWRDTPAYAAAFSPLRMLYIYPSLLLALTFIALLVCLHLLAPPEKKVWSLIALAVGILYATMASTNYTIQAIAVRLSLESGPPAGIQMFLPDNPNSVFNALASSYIYMALAMFFSGFIMRGSRLATAARWILWAQIISAAGQTGWSMFGLNETVFIATSLFWVVGAPSAFVLLAIMFKRSIGIGSSAAKQRSL